MSGLPLPKELPWELQFIFWLFIVIIGLLFGACLWWLARFVKSHDDFKDDVQTSIEKQGEKFDKSLKSVQETATSMNQTANKFKDDMQTQLMAVHRRVVEIEGSVGKVTTKVEAFGKQLDTIQKTAEHNEEALGKSAEILKHHNHMISKQGGVLTTIIKKLGHEKVMVTSKKSDNGEDT